MKRSLGFLLLLLCTPLFAGTLDKIDLSEIEDESIEIESPVWDGAKAGAVRVGKFDSSFDRTVAKKLASGWRNAGIQNQTLADSVDLGEILAGSMRAEGRKLGLNMLEPSSTGTPDWVVGGTIRQALVEIQHIYAGSLLFYAYLDVDVTIAKQGEPATTVRMRPARLFVMYNGGFGTGDEAQLALEKMILVGSQQILARLNREHFHAPALSTMNAKLAGLKTVTEQEGDLHLVGLSGVSGAAAALTSMLEKEKDENGRTVIVYALNNLGVAEHAPLLIRRYATEDADVRYATLLALDALGSEEALKLIREQGTKDKNVAIKRLAERLAAAR